MTFAIVEKLNHLAVHGLFNNRERAERHLALVIPGYVARGYYVDKTLTEDSFEIVEQVIVPPHQSSQASCESSRQRRSKKLAIEFRMARKLKTTATTEVSR